MCPSLTPVQPSPLLVRTEEGTRPAAGQEKVGRLGWTGKGKEEMVCNLAGAEPGRCGQRDVGLGAREGRRRVHVDAAVVARVHRQDAAQLELGLGARGAQDALHPAPSRVLAHQGEAHAGARCPAPQLHPRARRGAQDRGFGRQLRRGERPCGERAGGWRTNRILPRKDPPCSLPGSRRGPPPSLPPDTARSSPDADIPTLSALVRKRRKTGCWRVLWKEHPRAPDNLS